jgi:hypothetical protein
MALNHIVVARKLEQYIYVLLDYSELSSNNTSGIDNGNAALLLETQDAKYNG